MRNRLLALIGGAAAGAALTLAAPATADPGMPPCGQLSVVCNLIPMMPELDRDIDLTKQQPPAPVQEDLPPADVCDVACI